MLAARLAQDLLSTNVRLVEIILTPMEPLSLTTSTLATPSALWNVLLASTSGQATPMPVRLALFSASDVRFPQQTAHRLICAQSGIISIG